MTIALHGDASILTSDVAYLIHESHIEWEFGFSFLFLQNTRIQHKQIGNLHYVYGNMCN